MRKRNGFTLLELIMIITIIGIIAAVAIPKFLNMRREAQNAAAEANLGALRSAASIYYSKTAIDDYNYLCYTATNPYRSVDETPPCYPASVAELEDLLTSELTWPNLGIGQCYDSSTDTITLCN